MVILNLILVFVGRKTTTSPTSLFTSGVPFLAENRPIEPAAVNTDEGRRNNYYLLQSWKR